MSTSLSRLTVGYLATDTGADGVALAATIAATIGAAIDLVCVLREDELATRTQRTYSEKALTAQAQKWLDAGAALVPEGIEVDTHVVTAASFAEGLAGFATQTNARMIVIGGTSDGILGHHTLGPVGLGLAHYSPVPVALAPADHHRHPVPRLSEVTIAVAPGPHSDNPLPFGLALAAEGRLAVRLLTVVVDGGVPDPTNLATRQENVAAARRVLDEASSAAGDDITVEALVAEGATITQSLRALRWAPATSS